MAQFKLLAGLHLDENGRYKAGDVVESDTDLVAAFGTSKFQLLDGPRTKKAAKTEKSEKVEEVVEEKVEESSPVPDPIKEAAPTVQAPTHHTPTHHKPTLPHKKK